MHRTSALQLEVSVPGPCMWLRNADRRHQAWSCMHRRQKKRWPVHRSVRSINFAMGGAVI